MKKLLEVTFQALKEATKTGLKDSIIPDRMRKALEDDLFIFSGCKTEAQLREAAKLLRDADGKVKPFYKFKEDIQAIHKNYNEAYLQAEYNYATSTAQAAAKWAKYAEDGNEFDLQYRTAQDDRVRESHSRLHNVTLPFNSPFWDKYFAPNGWRCRCQVVQVRKGKFDLSDERIALKEGEAATTYLNPKGVNTLEIFRYNAGKQEVIFPPNHPYYQSKEQVTNIISPPQ